MRSISCSISSSSVPSICICCSCSRICSSSRSPVEERLFDGLAQVVQRLLAVAEVIVEIILEAALQQVVGERAEQVFHAHFARGIGNVFAVADAFHKSSFQLSAVCFQLKSHLLRADS